MLRANIPTRFLKAWAQNAAGPYIRTVPVDSQIGIQDGAASYNDGFVPDNFAPLSAGGVPPFGQDMNGALNEITTWDRWYQAGAPIPYDAAFATAIGGYPQGAILDSSIVLGAQWFSLNDNNLTNPDDPLTSVGWGRVGIQVGAPVGSFLPTGPGYGYVPMTGFALGSAASGSTYANDSNLFLYSHIWANFSNTQCPIFTSAGVPTTRGANAVADFLANKRLATPSATGAGFVGVDVSSSNLAGVPIVIGNTTTPGSIIGNNLQGLLIANLPVVTPAGAVAVSNGAITINGADQYAYTNTSGAGIGGGGAFGVSGFNALSASQAASSASFTGTPFGSNTAHNNVGRSMTVFWGLKT